MSMDYIRHYYGVPAKLPSFEGFGPRLSSDMAASVPKNQPIFCGTNNPCIRLSCVAH